MVYRHLREPPPLRRDFAGVDQPHEMIPEIVGRQRNQEPEDRRIAVGQGQHWEHIARQPLDVVDCYERVTCFQFSQTCFSGRRFVPVSGTCSYPASG